MKISMRTGNISTDERFFNLHPFRGTHWTTYVNEKFFESRGCAPSNSLTNYLNKRNGKCPFSEIKMQEKDSYCAVYRLYLLYLNNLCKLFLYVLYCCFFDK